MKISEQIAPSFRTTFNSHKKHQIYSGGRNSTKTSMIALKVVFNCLNENDCSTRKEIILAKMQSPYEKIEVLAERCNVDKSIVSRCLKNFVDSMKKYFE